ncbi:unnamed protein product [Euphydryas editha]|uniref:Uncharacterized protein n=1 Tax=Euphydryas editha TaxID=104508 RepID=A0AAU9TMD2_EUPED|nr:unnamed protein product [Euphydryas editha]
MDLKRRRTSITGNSPTKSSAAPSTRSIMATFFNGKQLEIQYIFDPSKNMSDRVLIAMNYVRSVFAGFGPSGAEEFLNILDAIESSRLHAH